MSQKKKSYELIKKGWGAEYIFASNDLYCGKILAFDKAGSKFSMHFHSIKDETWFVLDGSFELTIINTENAEREIIKLSKFDSFRVKPLVPHQLKALQDTSYIVEVSTADSVEDNYRVAPGDSQK